jgi:hypothetical protein
VQICRKQLIFLLISKSKAIAIFAFLKPCVEPLRPAAPWIGGKYALAPALVDRIEAVPNISGC